MGSEEENIPNATHLLLQAASAFSGDSFKRYKSTPDPMIGDLGSDDPPKYKKSSSFAAITRKVSFVGFKAPRSNSAVAFFRPFDSGSSGTLESNSTAGSEEVSGPTTTLLLRDLQDEKEGPLDQERNEDEAED